MRWDQEWYSGVLAMHGSERLNAPIFGTVAGVVSVSTLAGPREFSLAIVEGGLTPRTWHSRSAPPMPQQQQFCCGSPLRVLICKPELSSQWLSSKSTSRCETQTSRQPSVGRSQKKRCI